MQAHIRSHKHIWIALVSAAGMLLSQLAMAQSKTAHEVAEQVKDDMMGIIAERANIEAKGEGEYYKAVVDLFEPVVNFEYIANGVMGESSKKASKDQKARFAGVLKHSLMNTVSTYTQGLSGSGKYTIDVVPPKSDMTGKRRVNVGLEVKTQDGVNRLAFTMHLNSDNVWKIANMTLNGINLGVTFRAQFAQAVKKADGNIDAAIDSWSS